MKAVIRVETAEQGVAFRSLVGCKILEVFAVGKELFLVFALKWDETRRGGSIRLHFGHGGGYLVQQTSAVGENLIWGPKAGGGGHCRDSHVAVTLDFTEEKETSETETWISVERSVSDPLAFPDVGLRFSLWTDLGSSFGLSSPEYLRSVEARRVFDINAESFAMNEAVRLFRESEELVVDLIMDQSRLPGVGNIIKCEGLFAAKIFPLRRACELSDAEWKDLLEELREFSKHWYLHCQKPAWSRIFSNFWASLIPSFRIPSLFLLLCLHHFEEKCQWAVDGLLPFDACLWTLELFSLPDPCESDQRRKEACQCPHCHEQQIAVPN